MLKDLMYQARVNKDYGLTIPYEAPRAPTPAPQPMPTIQPLPPIEDVEDFAPEDFVTNAVRSPEPERLTGQDALEEWAAQTEMIRQGKAIPAIRRPSNRALRELRCPNCQCEFTAEVES
jgi:hypothetical protein